MRNRHLVVLLAIGLISCGKKESKTDGETKSTKPATNGNLYPAYQPSSAKWGYIDSNGAWVIQPTYWAAGYFSEHRAGVKIDSTKYQYGFIDETGKVVIKPEFSYDRDRGMPEFQGGFAVVQRDSDSAWVVIDTSGKVTFTAEKGSSLGPPSEGAMTYCQNVLDRDKHTCGHIDGNGKPVTPQTSGLNQIAAFSDGMAMVTSNDMKRGFIDRTGKLVIPMTLTSATEFGSGLALVDPGDGKCVYYDKAGKVALPGPYQCGKSGPFIEGLAAATDADGKETCIDPTGKVVGTKCLRLHDGVAYGGAKDGKAVFVDAKGNEKFKIEVDKDAGLFFVPFKQGMWRFVTAKANSVVDVVYVSPAGEVFSHGMATKR